MIKTLILQTLVLLIISCGMQKDTFLPETNNQCPEDGICTVEVIKNKEYLLKRDKFGLPYGYLADGNKTIIKFEYKRREIPNVADGNYSEVVYIQLNPNNLECFLQDEALRQANVLFGRYCFCRGQTGLYNVLQGQLEVKQIKENKYSVTLNFKVNEVPQVIKTINYNLAL